MVGEYKDEAKSVSNKVEAEVEAELGNYCGYHHP